GSGQIGTLGGKRQGHELHNRRLARGFFQSFSAGLHQNQPALAPPKPAFFIARKSWASAPNPPGKSASSRRGSARCRCTSRKAHSISCCRLGRVVPYTRCFNSARVYGGRPFSRPSIQAASVTVGSRPHKYHASM